MQFFKLLGMGTNRQQPPPLVKFTRAEAYEKRIAHLLELCSEQMLKDGMEKAALEEDYEAAILFRNELDRRNGIASFPSA
jgi:hypothetical protein